jgi:hypothetical protein
MLTRQPGRVLSVYRVSTEPAPLISDVWPFFAFPAVSSRQKFGLTWTRPVADHGMASQRSAAHSGPAEILVAHAASRALKRVYIRDRFRCVTVVLLVYSSSSTFWKRQLPCTICRDILGKESLLLFVFPCLYAQRRSLAIKNAPGWGWLQHRQAKKKVMRRR